MNSLRPIVGLTLLFAATAAAGAASALALKPDIVVAQDGSGGFSTVQAAVDSVATNNRERTIIFIKNLTIDNPASLGLKPITVFSTGEGTRIVIQNAEVLGLGGDTLSLWTRGMYYHRDLHVTGTYHFVGPRGTCYMADSLIEVLRSVTNALFNEGMQDERQKFVLQRCQIVSKVPFGLGSHFRDAAWYFIDCQFPDTLKADGKIFVAQSNPDRPQPVSAMFKWATD